MGALPRAFQQCLDQPHIVALATMERVAPTRPPGAFKPDTKMLPLIALATERALYLHHATASGDTVGDRIAVQELGPIEHSFPLLKGTHYKGEYVNRKP